MRQTINFGILNLILAISFGRNEKKSLKNPIENILSNFKNPQIDSKRVYEIFST